MGIRWNKKRKKAKPVICDWGSVFDGGLKEHRCGCCNRHLEYDFVFCPECGIEIDWKEEE